MRFWCLLALIGLLAVGCTRPEVTDSPLALQPGDVLQPELAFAPETPWPAGAEVTVGMLVRGTRTDGKRYYLHDKDVDLDRTVMQGKVTFFSGEKVLGEPHHLPFVHDC